MTMVSRASILIVGDSHQDLRIHAATLTRSGFNVVTAHTQVEVDAVLPFQTPDLVLIEAGLNGGEGFDLCRWLKSRPALVNVPVIFITESRSPEVVDRVYDAGGVDFIAKPCRLSEFLARVEIQIKLHNLLLKVEHLQEIAIDANPLTHLPGNNTIVATIQRAIDTGADVALIYTDLDNFKSYNDCYGFSAGDDVLLFNANTLQDVVLNVCGLDGFLGHIGGDDFVMMVPADKLQDVGNMVVRAFDEGIPEFYSEKDRERGYLMAKDRNGGIRRHPLVAISLAGIILRNKGFSRYVEVATACAELKKEAKAQEGSTLFVDRRTQPV